MATTFALDTAARPHDGKKYGRVLHLINGEDYSGAERVQDLLALRLGECGFDVGLACVKPGIFAKARAAQHVPLYDTPMRSRFDFRTVRQLARLIRTEGYDLLHTHSARTVLVGRPAAALAGVPLVHHMHCQTATEVGQPILRRMNAWTERLSLIKAAGIIAVSPTLCDYLRRQRVPERVVRLIPNGVPSPGPLEPRAPGRDGWTIGTIAMFRPRKGIEVLLRALHHLRRQGLPVRLRAVGRFQTSDYEAETKRLVTQLGLDDAVDWTGFRQDVAAELARMDLFVLPSVLAEGMPMAVLEAMAAGVPSIGSRVPGIIDVIEDGVSGALCTAGDEDALAAALNRFIAGELNWQTIRETAYRLHAEKYSDTAMAREVARLYREIL